MCATLRHRPATREQSRKRGPTCCSTAPHSLLHSRPTPTALSSPPKPSPAATSRAAAVSGDGDAVLRQAGEELVKHLLVVLTRGLGHLLHLLGHLINLVVEEQVSAC